MKEKQTIHRLCPCHHYDIEGIQTWLEDMAKEGWLLEKGGYGLGTFTFNRNQPIQCRYRLEVIFEGKKSYQERLEYLEMLKDFGWTHVTDFQGFEIFRTEDPNATEISTDPVVQSLTLKKLNRAGIHRILFLVFYFSLQFFNRRLSWMYFFRSAVSLGPMAMIMMTAFIAMALIMALHDLWRIHLLEKKLRNGHQANNAKNWRSHALAHRTFSILPYVIGICAICLWLSGLFMSLNGIPMESNPIDPPFVTVADLADSNYELTEPPLSGNNQYICWSNPLSPVNYEWREYAKFTADGVDNNGFLVVNYHETASEWIAKGLVDDYYTYEFNRFQGIGNLNTSDFGLDDVRVFGRHGSYEMVIRHGTIVIHATYSQWNNGAVPDWQILLEAMAEMLLN